MESQFTEWKESWRNEYLKTICAFANTEGGTLTVGVDDNGRVSVPRIPKHCSRSYRTRYVTNSASYRS